jgi:hypothetical protein
MLMKENTEKTKLLQLGTRKVITMNFSKIVTLPKTFTENFLDGNMLVQLTLTPDGKLILEPVHSSKN